MENHPLTPMTDANLVRVLGRQTDGTVGLVPYATVEQGAMAIRKAMTALKEHGPPLRHRRCGERRPPDGDRRGGGAPRADHRRLRRGDGAAGEFPPRRTAEGPGDPGALPSVQGHAAVLAGSCSRATLAQLGVARDHVPVLELDPLATPDADALARTGAGLGGGQARRHAGGDRRFRPAGQGCRRCSRSWGAMPPARWSRTRWRRSPTAWWRAAFAAWWWRAARPPARRWRGWACAACASARRSIPACPGPMPRAAANRCCWR